MPDGQQEVLDLRSVKGSQKTEGETVKLETSRTDPYSPAWAKEVKPVAIWVLALVTAVMLLPFALLLWLTPEVVFTIKDPAGQHVAAITGALVDARLKNLLDWAKTILPSAVGFASALVGYYFGTRVGASDNQTPQKPGSGSPAVNPGPARNPSSNPQQPIPNTESPKGASGSSEP
jgi:hypothetical protein